jgi:outer membrane protein
VDTRRIEAESVPFARALEAIKQEFAPREQQIREFQKQINADRERFDKERDKLQPAERQRRGNELQNAMTKSDQMAVALAEDIERRKKETLGGLIAEANAAIKAVAEAGKFDLVLQQATYISPGIDITDQVLKEMAKRTAAKP